MQSNLRRVEGARAQGELIAAGGGLRMALDCDQCKRRWPGMSVEIASLVFFFQAEDGIRDLTVTGVQTCALPISFGVGANSTGPCKQKAAATVLGQRRDEEVCVPPVAFYRRPISVRRVASVSGKEIGRASCRERGEISVVAVSFKKKKT